MSQFRIINIRRYGKIDVIPLKKEERIFDALEWLAAMPVRPKI